MTTPEPHPVVLRAHIAPRYGVRHPEPAEGPVGLEPLACRSCGDPVPWQWIARLGRYMPPPPTCPTCKQQAAEDERTARSNAALAAAGIGERYRGYSWDRCVWPMDEFDTLDDMRRWIADREEHEGGRWLGCMWRDAQAFTTLRDWVPSQGSVYVEGIHGSGKTLLAMCVAERLIGGGITYEDVLDPVTGRVLGCRRRGAHVLVTSERELLDQTTQRRLGFDADSDGGLGPSPVYAAKRAGVLIMDDIGRDPKAGHLLHSIIDYRYRAQAPVIVTSNAGLDKMRDVLGGPVASRLEDMTRGRRLRLHYEWRRGE